MQLQSECNADTRNETTRHNNIVVPRFLRGSLTLSDRENNSVIRRNPLTLNASERHNSSVIQRTPISYRATQEHFHNEPATRDVSSRLDSRETLDPQNRQSWIIEPNEPASIAYSRNSTFADRDRPFPDFESFRTTSILTLRNRAEKHVQRMNVC